MKRAGALFFVLLLAAALCCACAAEQPQPAADIDPGLDTTEEVTLTVWGSLTDFPALEPVISSFETIYPNCTIIYKLLDDYDDNIYAKLQNETKTANMFLGYRDTYRNHPELSEFALDYALAEGFEFDLSQLNQVLTASAICDDGGQYVIPMGLESRGLAVNTSLLAEHGLDVPTNFAEFTAACDALVAAGLVPIQNYHDDCVMQLMYAMVANSVVHDPDYETIFASMNAKEPGTSQYLAEVFAILDDFTKKGYLSYAENMNVTAAHYDVEGSYQAAVMNFLEGDVAFCPTTASCFCSIASRETLSPEFTAAPFEYQFIASPLAEDGSYGYLQPWLGICINKLSDHVDWSAAFVNFLCQKENMATVAELKGFIPNTAESVTDHRFDSILALDDQHITNLSMFTNNFYSQLRSTLQRLGHPFEYAGEAGGFEPQDGQTYYIRDNGVYVETDPAAAAAGTTLYSECYKKRAIVPAGDAAFAALDGVTYFILTDGAYQPVADPTALPAGTPLFVDDYKQAGTLGDEKFTYDETVEYYLLTDSGFIPAPAQEELEAGVKLFIPEARTPYRMNSRTALDYYESQIAG